MSTPPRSLSFAVGTSLLSASLSLGVAACTDAKPKDDPKSNKSEKKTVEVKTVNEGPQPEQPETIKSVNPGPEQPPDGTEIKPEDSSLGEPVVGVNPGPEPEQPPPQPVGVNVGPSPKK
jgi:hypothetical protein